MPLRVKSPIFKKVRNWRKKLLHIFASGELPIPLSRQLVSLYEKATGIGALESLQGDFWFQEKTLFEIGVGDCVTVKPEEKRYIKVKPMSDPPTTDVLEDACRGSGVKKPAGPTACLQSEFVVLKSEHFEKPWTTIQSLSEFASDSLLNFVKTLRVEGERPIIKQNKSQEVQEVDHGPRKPWPKKDRGAACHCWQLGWASHVAPVAVAVLTTMFS